eukprot:2252120-Prymnesium_polylepis.1
MSNTTATGGDASSHDAEPVSTPDTPPVAVPCAGPKRRFRPASTSDSWIRFASALSTACASGSAVNGSRPK